MNNNEIKKITQQFGIEYKEIKKPKEAFLANVYVLDNQYILRGRSIETGTQNKFEKELQLIEKIRSIAPIQFPNPQQIKEHAAQFDTNNFKEKIKSYINETWQEHNSPK